MPTAVTNCMKPNFTLVTSSAAIAIITRPQGRNRHLKISNIHHVRFFFKISPQKLAVIAGYVKTGLFAPVYKIKHEKGGGQDFTR